MLTYCLFILFISIVTFKCLCAKTFMDDSGFEDVFLEAPGHLVVVSYGKKMVTAGLFFNSSEVTHPPSTIGWYHNETEGSHFTLMLIDIDAPTKYMPHHRPVVHWLVVNIHHNNIEAGQTIVKYFLPSPPAGLGMHRYLFLVYKQQTHHSFIDIVQTFTLNKFARLKFDLKKFAYVHDLGEPYAANYFTSSKPEVNITIESPDMAMYIYKNYYIGKEVKLDLLNMTEY